MRSRARERARLSSGIRGNGWCVTHRLLQAVEYNAFSLAEDLEFGIELGLHGYRVFYAGEAHACQEMVADAGTARKQRQRWEHGRFQLIRTRTLPLLRAALKRRSAICLDLALDLIVLPLSYVALNVGALLLISVLATCSEPRVSQLDMAVARLHRNACDLRHTRLATERYRRTRSAGSGRSAILRDLEGRANAGTSPLQGVDTHRPQNLVVSRPMRQLQPRIISSSR